MARQPSPLKPPRKSRLYNIEEKLIAVEMIKRAGGKISDKVHAAIKEALNAPDLDISTLYRWMRDVSEISNRVMKSDTLPGRYDRGRVTFLREVKVPEGTAPKPDDQIVRVVDHRGNLVTLNMTKEIEDAEGALRTLYQQVALRYLEHALDPEVIDKVKGRDAVMAANIANSNARVMNALPDDVMQVLPKLVKLMKERGIDPVQVFYKMLAELERMADK